MKTVVCIASGPSLTADDCALVKASGHLAIAVNNSYLLAPFADVLYAGDRAWWAQYGKAARAIMGECWTASPDAVERFGIHRFEARDFENSGFQAIELAVLEKKADRVILLGYDMQHTGGKRHWHEDHPGQMENADAVADWPGRFVGLSARFAHVDFVNCTRETALTCFRRMELRDALCKPEN
ncbi:MAG: hypothetical protein KUL86_06000 [Castellaniella sp.]|nr:hypothetical protein [Castellaniella sp.]